MVMRHQRDQGESRVRTALCGIQDVLDDRNAPRSEDVLVCRQRALVDGAVPAPADSV